jgi:hypothetical protein
LGFSANESDKLTGSLSADPQPLAQRVSRYRPLVGGTVVGVLLPGLNQQPRWEGVGRVLHRLLLGCGVLLAVNLAVGDVRS